MSDPLRGAAITCRKGAGEHLRRQPALCSLLNFVCSRSDIVVDSRHAPATNGRHGRGFARHALGRERGACAASASWVLHLCLHPYASTKTHLFMHTCSILTDPRTPANTEQTLM
ncbi:hypothetical protein MRX96_043071 [Rhipicephalus microplus]